MKRGRSPLLRSLSPLRAVEEKGRLYHLQESRQNHPLLKEKEPKGNYNLVEGEQTKDLAKGDNPLNLPYSDSELEHELAETQGDEQVEQVAEHYPNLPSPTPPDEHSQPLAKASSSKPKASKA